MSTGPTRRGRGEQLVESDTYSGLQHQNVNLRWRVEGRANGAENATESLGDYVTEPAGGLARDEVAELVAMRVRLQAVPHDYRDDEFTLPASVRFWYEMSTSPKPQTAVDPQNEIEPIPEEDIGDLTLRLFTHGDDDDPDQMYNYFGEIQTPAFDTTTDNTLSSSGISDTDTYYVNFRELGGDYVFDRHDDIFHHFRQSTQVVSTGSGNGASGIANIHMSIDLWWDVRVE